jgi:hypothetical protein
MMNTLGIASWGFLIGAMGQWAFYYRIFPRLPAWLVMGDLFIPWLTVFIISFCNRPPFGPRPFRHCLIFAMAWYAAMTLLAEALHFFLQPVPRGHFSLIAGRVLMYVFGAVSITVFVRACITLRGYETKPDA